MRNLILLQEHRQCVEVPLPTSTTKRQGRRHNNKPCDVTFDPATELMINAGGSDTTGGNNSTASPFGIPEQTFLLCSNGMLICTRAISTINSEADSSTHETKNIEWICDLSLLEESNKQQQEEENVEGDNVDNNNNGFKNHQWFQATFVDDIESIVVLSHEGTIATVSPITGEASCVGVFENGIYAAQWSPDMELLVLVTRESILASNQEEEPVPDSTSTTSSWSTVVLTMNTSFEIVTETKLSEEAIYPNDPTNKSTNSTGSEMSICWKFDGTLLALSSVDVSDQIRRIRILERDTLVVKHVGLSEDGKGRTVLNLSNTSPITWSGIECSRRITAIQATGKKSCKIIFFESNGLRNKEFSLRNINNKIDKVTHLCWNVESDLLAVTIVRSTTGPQNDESSPTTDNDAITSNSSSRVQLWHRNNYHWYLKYELTFPNEEVGCTKFDIEKPYRLVVTLQQQQQSSLLNNMVEWRTFDFCWDICSEPEHQQQRRSSSNNMGLTANTDGSLLNLTPLERQIVPPPMSTCMLDMSSALDTTAANILGVAFVPSAPINSEVTISCRMTMVVHLSNGELALVGYEDNNGTSSSIISSSAVTNKKKERFVSPTILGRVKLQDLVMASSSSSLSTYSDAPTMLLDHTAIRQVTVVRVQQSQQPSSHSEENTEIETSVISTTTTIRLLAVYCGTITKHNNKQHTTSSLLLMDELIVMDIVVASSSSPPSTSNNTSNNKNGTSPVVVEVKSIELVDKITLEGKVLRMVNWINDHDEEEEQNQRVLMEYNDGSLYVYSVKDGCVMPLMNDSSGGGDDVTLPMEPFMEPCPWIQGITVKQPQPTAPQDVLELDPPYSSTPLVFGLSCRQRLYYCGEHMLCATSSSFVVSHTHGFLIFVSLGSRAQLHFIPLTKLAQWDPLSGMGEHEQLFMTEGYEPRQVERGSRIVCVRHDSPSVILELPRGNLELVVARALTLPFCMKLIHSQNYNQALDVMRRNKIDLNLLVDFNIQKFLQHIPIFLEQITNVDYLNLFIATLFDGNITHTKYPIPDWMFLTNENKNEADATTTATTAAMTTGPTNNNNNKVNVICRALRKVMLEMEEQKEEEVHHRDDEKNGNGTTTTKNNNTTLLLPILSTFAKESPPQLEPALDLIRTRALSAEQEKYNNSRALEDSSTPKVFYRGSTNNGNTNQVMIPPAYNKQKKKSRKALLLMDGPQKAIQYLAFLSDYPLLYNTALGMYDWDFAKAVARNSQMDPKLYLSEIKRWMTMSSSKQTNLAKYEVNIKLHRYDRALECLSLCYRDVLTLQTSEITATNAKQTAEKEDETSQQKLNKPKQEETNTTTNSVSTSNNNNKEDSSIVDASNATSIFDQCMILMNEHELHELGLTLFSDLREERQQILISLGERFMTKQQYQQALLMFLKANDLTGAMKASRALRDWKTFMKCLYDDCCIKQQMTPKEIQQTQSKMAQDLSKEFIEQYAPTLTGLTKRQCYMDSARLLLDYVWSCGNGGDNDREEEENQQYEDRIIDILLEGKVWMDAYRIASTVFFERVDLVESCIDAAILFASECCMDLQTRANTFETTNVRYAEVLEIRRDAKIAAVEAGDDLIEGGGDAGSVYSMASQMTNSSAGSLASYASGSSMGSTRSTSSSFSTVISAGSNSGNTFSIMSKTNKHKSKYNVLGAGAGTKKKKKNKKSQQQNKKRIRPGTEEELKSLVDELRQCCIFEDEYRDIFDTIEFLTKVIPTTANDDDNDNNEKIVDAAESLWNQYNEFILRLQTSQEKRLETKTRQDETKCQESGLNHPHQHPSIILPCEQEVDALKCQPMPEYLQHFFRIQ